MADYFLERQVREGRGQQVALICDSGNFTYIQLLEAAQQAAFALAESGLGAEQRLVLALEDDLEFVAAFFGALRLGATVIMLNPQLTPQQIAEHCREARARVLLWAGQTENLPPGCCHLQALTLGEKVLECYPTHRDDVAIWLFSGGTTGRPKAVLQSHRSFFNTCQHYALNFLGYCGQDRSLSVPKLFFGYALGSNLLFPFAAGGTAILFRAKPTPALLYSLIEEHRPTIFVQVPTMLHQMLQFPDSSRRDLSSLRAITSAGEALPEALATSWKAQFGQEILDGLGTAEMWHIFLSNHPRDVRPGSLGKVVPGFEVKVCDDHGQEVSPGQVGRLWAGGDSRALCYWQNSAASQEALVGRYFASSDLVYRDADGYFYYAGRGDELLKIHGRWLAPAEVEGILLGHPEVQECAVVGFDGEDGLVRPRAFVVCQQPRQQLAEQLKELCLNQLERFKQPRHIEFLEILPRTHLGKVDRKELRSRPLGKTL